jgi:alkyl hydroperoxide reductase subunit F
LKLRERVDNIKKKGKIFEIKTDRSKYFSKSIVIASGKQPKKLNVPGEDNLYNRGVSYCATCDAPLFRDKNVAVVGGGNSAIQAALLLSKYASRVHVITINNKLLGEDILTKKIEANKKIILVTNARTSALLGDNHVTGLKFVKDGKETAIFINGVFVEIGLVTGCDFIKLVNKNKWGEIKIKRSTKSTEENMTNVQGIFAAGDCTDIPSKQIIVAAGEGAKAALAAIDYVEHLSNKD